MLHGFFSLAISTFLHLHSAVDFIIYIRLPSLNQIYLKWSQLTSDEQWLARRAGSPPKTLSKRTFSDFLIHQTTALAPVFVLPADMQRHA
jgi:hypothetical protein